MVLTKFSLLFQAVLLNLTEGGKNIITILNNTSASVVRIYVRTSGNIFCKTKHKPKGVIWIPVLYICILSCILIFIFCRVWSFLPKYVYLPG